MSATTEPAVAPTENVNRLAIGPVFDKLSTQEKLYAHHLSRASWSGTRIILQQTSPEAEAVFDFIIEVYRSVNGSWSQLERETGASAADIHAFQEYAASFLGGLGNYYGDNGQKFTPKVDLQAITKIASVSSSSETLLQKISQQLYAKPPYNIGYPSDKAQSNYYLKGSPSSASITKEEIDAIGQIMAKHSVEPENTRIQKTIDDTGTVFEVLQASTGDKSSQQSLHVLQDSPRVCLAQGDHALALGKVCKELETARQYASNDVQQRVLDEYIASFRTGDMNSYRESQKLWVKDASPTVENTIGFVEMYRDPAGVRSEWQGVVCIADKDETRKLRDFVDQSKKFIRLLPWAVPHVNDGQGPFEKDQFEQPDFTIVHGLTFCTSNMWYATNIPNYNDIRETYGFKNIVILNRLAVLNDPANPCHFVPSSDKDLYRSSIYAVEFIDTSVHELLGHGTGKLLSETSPGVFNFDRSDLPINSLTEKPIQSWYKPGETWTSIFGEIGTAVEESRASLISYYLMDEQELLKMFGYSSDSTPKSDDLIYTTYIRIGVSGLKALEAFSEEDQTWGDPHARGDFAILRWLLTDGNGVISIKHDHEGPDSGLTVHVDRAKILSYGKPSLGRLLHKLHIWRCSPDLSSCRNLYEPLTAIEGEVETWRKIVCEREEPKWRFVQANTFLEEGSASKVFVKEYDATNEGMIQSWAERDV